MTKRRNMMGCSDVDHGHRLTQIGPAKMVLVVRDGVEFIVGRIPIRLYIDGCVIDVRDLDVDFAIRLDSNHEIGAEGTIETWWNDVSHRLREALISAFKHPLSILVTGLTAVLIPGWGVAVVSLYLGARMGIWFARPGDDYKDEWGNVYRIAMRDRWGRLAYDKNGYAWRDAAFKPRFEAVELATKGQSGWMAMPDGRYRSVTKASR